MPDRVWAVRLAVPAAQDFAEIIQWSRERFGPAQADRYRQWLRAAIEELEAGPSHALSRSREDIGPGLRVLHAARKGKPARHFLLYRQSGESGIEIVRLLHESMDLGRHALPLD